MRRIVLALGLGAVSCGRGPDTGLPVLPLMELGAFEYTERMVLPKSVTRWSGRRVRAAGFMNPTSQARGLTTFLLVKDRASCCFGRRPQIHHYIEVRLKPGRTADYTTDSVTVEGRFLIEDRWDGDWQLGLYWMDDAEVVR